MPSLVRTYVEQMQSDDTALAAEFEDALKAIVNAMREESLVKGFKLNVKKTKAMVSVSK